MKCLDASMYAYFNSSCRSEEKFLKINAEVWNNSVFFGTVIVFWFFIHKNVLDVNHSYACWWLWFEIIVQRMKQRDYPLRITSQYSSSSFTQQKFICAFCMQGTVLDARETRWWEKVCRVPSLLEFVIQIERQTLIKQLNNRQRIVLRRKRN